MRAAEVGEAALGERAQQVEGGRGLVVAAHHALRIGPAGDGLELVVVHDVAEVRRQLDAVALLGRRRARLGELARDAADLQRRDAGAVREHERHLQDDLELVADVVGRELGERLRAVARVQQEALALGDRARAWRAACALRPRTRAAACARSSRERGLERGRRRATRAVARRGSAASSWAPSRGSAADCGAVMRSARLTGTRRAGGCPARARAAGASPRTAAAPASAG